MNSSAPIEALRNKMAEDIAREGFSIHYVYGDPAGRTPRQSASIPTRMDIHTHGLNETYAHRELQIVLPIEPRVASTIFHNMASQIEEGKTFKPNKTYSGILEGQEILVLENPKAKNFGPERAPLRVILPDPKGKLPTPEDPSAAYPIYSSQVSFP